MNNTETERQEEYEIPVMHILAKKFHDTYERLAPEFGYTTRMDTRKFNPMTANGKLMISVCEELFGAPKGQKAVTLYIPEKGSIGHSIVRSFVRMEFPYDGTRITHEQASKILFEISKAEDKEIQKLIDKIFNPKNNG